ncbi:hypothetical protein N0B28_13505 [Pseudomonas sp. SD17-1]|uniref:hypothetical protein n=1 Tax=Pseudomonas sp. SD17-1 TaxID=2976883 RepID=UPI0023DA52FD|nr:hypothetical protein [Pseudomonas sp. SD17-1]WEJ19321.1 hypothetical protein N0B28_13505 [Pseudomonas sp. SD17-1]
MKEDLLVPAIVALAVGLIAGMVSLVVSILAKDQKTSEFRQAWIDGLRNDVSQLVAHFGVVKTISKIMRARPRTEVDEYLIAKQEQFLEMEMLVSRIRLRLNPSEHVVMLRLLQNLEHIREEELDPRAERITIEAQDILKTEWERVKLGEPSFVWLKRVSKAGVLSALAIGVGIFAAVFVEYFEASRSGW